jgi:hypothetical protein
MDLTIFSDVESEVRGYIRSFPVIFDRAVGSTMIDEVAMSSEWEIESRAMYSSSCAFMIGLLCP